MFCAILAVTNTAKSQFPYYMGQANPYYPPSYYSIDNLGLGKNISIHKGGAPATYYPKLLLHSSVDDFSTKAILRIQDKVDNAMGSPQLQFWSNEYHTTNEWFVGKIQAVTDPNITGDILSGGLNIPGGLAFYSKKRK